MAHRYVNDVTVRRSFTAAPRSAPLRAASRLGALHRCATRLFSASLSSTYFIHFRRTAPQRRATQRYSPLLTSTQLDELFHSFPPRLRAARRGAPPRTSSPLGSTQLDRSFIHSRRLAAHRTASRRGSSQLHSTVFHSFPPAASCRYAPPQLCAIGYLARIAPIRLSAFSAAACGVIPSRTTSASAAPQICWAFASA